jgi:hypothetical protein
MKSGPVVPGSSLTSKPAWLNTHGIRPRRLFLIYGGSRVSESRPMDKSESTTAQKLARAASNFEWNATRK